MANLRKLGVNKSARERKGRQNLPQKVPSEKFSLGVVFSPRNQRENVHSKSANFEGRHSGGHLLGRPLLFTSEKRSRKMGPEFGIAPEASLQRLPQPFWVLLTSVPTQPLHIQDWQQQDEAISWGASKQHLKLQQPRNYDFRVSLFNLPRSRIGNDREMTTSPPGHHREAKTALTTTAKLTTLRANNREMTAFAESCNNREM